MNNLQLFEKTLNELGVPYKRDTAGSGVVEIVIADDGSDSRNNSYVGFVSVWKFKNGVLVEYGSFE